MSLKITQDELRQIIIEEVHAALNKKQQLDEVSFKELVLGMIIAQTGLGSAAAKAAEAGDWGVLNQVEDFQVDSKNIKDGVKSYEEVSNKSVQTAKGSSLANTADSIKEISTDQCIASIESTLVEAKEVNGYEGSISIQCDDGLEVHFEYSKVTDNLKHETNELAKLTVKAPSNDSIEGNFTLKDGAVQKAKQALDYAQKQHPELKAGMGTYKTAKQLKANN